MFDSVPLLLSNSHVPENIRRDDELLVVQVISELSQVVHIRQLLPKLVTEENQKKNNER